MTVRTSDADLERDREEIVRFLHENLPTPSNDLRFEWLYLRNPSGPARVWLAMDAKGRTIGTEAAFPRWVWFDQVPRQAWVLGELVCMLVRQVRIPAKVYEYLRLGKPILALTPTCSDTAVLLSEVGGATIVDPSDEDSILSMLPAFLTTVRSDTHPLPQLQKVRGFSRRKQVAELAHCLNQLIPSPIARPAS